MVNRKINLILSQIRRRPFHRRRVTGKTHVDDVKYSSFSYICHIKKIHATCMNATLTNIFKNLIEFLMYQGVVAFGLISQYCPCAFKHVLFYLFHVR